MKHELQEIVAVVNNKGGVGKTATVQSLASGIVRLNHNLRVLVIDLDPQCNLSSLFGVRDNEYDNIYNAMCKQSGVPVYKCKNGVYAVPGSAQMENIEQHLPGGPSLREQMKSYTVLLGCLQDNDCHDMTGEGLKTVFDDFDYIFIDCPPALSKNTYNLTLATTDQVTQTTHPIGVGIVLGTTHQPIYDAQLLTGKQALYVTGTIENGNINIMRFLYSSQLLDTTQQGTPSSIADTFG